MGVFWSMCRREEEEHFVSQIISVLWSLQKEYFFKTLRNQEKGDLHILPTVPPSRLEWKRHLRCFWGWAACSCSHEGAAMAAKSPKQMAGVWVWSGLLRFQEEQRQNCWLLGELQMHTGTASHVFSQSLLHKPMGHEHSGGVSASGKNAVEQ